MSKYRRFLRCGAVGVCAALALTACGSGSGSSSADASGKHLTKIKMSIDNAGGDFVDAFIAKDEGIFEKNGLDVDISVTNGAPALAALRSGSYQFGMFGGAEVLNANAQGFDVQVLADVENRWPYELFGSKSVASAADLKGKNVGITNAGTQTDLAARQALSELGVPASSVAFTSTGSVDNLNSALLSGSVAAGVAHPPASLQLEQKGVKVLYDLRKVPGATALTLSASKSYIADHKDIVQKMVTSIVEAAQLGATDEDVLSKALQKNVQGLDDPTVLKQTADFQKTLVNSPPSALASDFEATVKQLGETNAKVKDLNLSSIVDNSFVQAASTS